MAKYGVPAVGIAVVDDFAIDWARTYGVVDAATGEAATTESRFQAASIGKVVVATAALALVERGVLGLDADVNGSLRSWRIPENELTRREKVTLRRLLSHTAGTTVAGFRGYAAGEPVPDLRQVLDGLPPANSAPIRVDVAPGSVQRYSGGGYVVLQQLLEDVTGVPFAQLLREVVLAPAAMPASTFTTPLPASLAVHAVTGHRRGGRPIPGRWHTYPEQGTGASLWATPSDLARFAISLMRAYAGERGQLLSPEMVQVMLTPVDGDRALGPTVHDDGGDRLYFMHPGGNEGFRCLLVAYPKRGEAVVVMTNSDDGEPLCREILRSVSVTYGWVD